MTYSGNHTSSAGNLFPLHVEEWRPVVGLEGRYEVSDMGQLRHARRRVILKPAVFGVNRYLRVSVFVGGPGPLSLHVHRAVCEAFNGPKPEWADCVRHLNDESYDNRAVNLAWGTNTDNMQDRLRNGRNPEANRDACDSGHLYVEGNYSIDRGARRCLVCHRDRERARRTAARAAA